MGKSDLFNKSAGRFIRLPGKGRGKKKGKVQEATGRNAACANRLACSTQRSIFTEKTIGLA